MTYRTKQLCDVCGERPKDQWTCANCGWYQLRDAAKLPAGATWDDPIDPNAVTQEGADISLSHATAIFAAGGAQPLKKYLSANDASRKKLKQQLLHRDQPEATGGSGDGN